MRSRIIKPDFFGHADLFDAEYEAKLPLRVAFAGLWCVADREGRFAWKPRELKAKVLPHDVLDFASVLDALEGAGFVRRYEVEGKAYGCIPTWHAHQNVHKYEQESRLPEPPVPGTQKRATHVRAGTTAPAGRYTVGVPATPVKALAPAGSEVRAPKRQTAAKSAAAKATPDAKPKGGYVTWACEIWEEKTGGVIAFGVMGRWIKPLADRHGERPVLDALTAYVEGQDEQYRSPKNFSENYGRWSGKSKSAMTQYEALAEQIRLSEEGCLND